mmetsp:Transcript_6857/g.10177  ORF Transcript_6857/g.10177 Transcript_6857/m.10177 type:complete len:83 (+) Transcript_6857:812-1060(+)
MLIQIAIMLNNQKKTNEQQFHANTTATTLTLIQFVIHLLFFFAIASSDSVVSPSFEGVLIKSEASSIEPVVPPKHNEVLLLE